VGCCDRPEFPDTGIGLIEELERALAEPLHRAEIVDTGRAKLYCVDSFDGSSWSNSSIPLEERARAHERYESWILDQVVPWIHHDCGGPQEIATFGVSLVLQQLVRSVFSANNRSVVTPSWMSGTLQVNDALALTYNRLYIVIFTLIVFAILLAVLKRTRLGLDIRAVSQNRAMARAMGIRSEWVDAMTFGLGAGIAGVAGVALSQLTNVGPNLGQSYIIDSFMVVVFGGVGNLWGTFIGGVSLGVINKLLEPYAGAVLGKIFVLVALILFIQRRPRGLFPQTGRAAEAA